jgi:hypothetical protein
MLEKAIPYLLSMEWNRGLTSVEPPFFFLDDEKNGLSAPMKARLTL